MKCKCKEPKMKWTNIHNINTFQCLENELYLGGINEQGENITVVLNTIEVLEWVDIEYLRKEAIKYINQLNK